MTYTLTLVCPDEVGEADRRAAEPRYRRALDEALGGARLVLPTWRACPGIVARHGDSPDRSALTDAEREVAERWLAAEAAATTAAFGPLVPRSIVRMWRAAMRGAT